MSTTRIDSQVIALEIASTQPQEFKRLFKNVLDATFPLSVVPAPSVLAGQFTKGRVDYVNVVKLPKGTEVRLSFYDAVKTPLNSKGKPVPNKESFVSYLSVSVYPVNAKPYSFSLFPNQLPWKNGKAKAVAAHEADLAKLKALAQLNGIDLSTPSSWCKVYSQGWDE